MTDRLQQFRRMLVGGVPTTRITRAELADLMVTDTEAARSGELKHPRMVISSNGAVIVDYHHNRAFRDIVLEADIIDADGMPMVIATRLLCKEPLAERVATTDFIQDASAAAARDGVRFFFLGASPGVAETAANFLRDKYPGLQIVGIRHGYFARDEEAALCDEILAARTDVLWIGLGSPIQESFALRNRARLAGLAWLRTCGGMFDHYSGKFRRAPMWMQRNGLEWLHRAYYEPIRLGRRYLSSNLPALFYLATQTTDNDDRMRANRTRRNALRS